MAPVLAVKTAAQTEAIVDDNAINPSVVTGANTRQVVHVSLIFDGVTFTPDALYDALNAAYGTVTSPKNVAGGHGAFIFNIST